MFTGLIEAKGTLTQRIPQGADARLTIAGVSSSEHDPLVLGESIAVDGVCLTVAKIVAEGTFEVDASSETLAKTTLGSVALGAAVNLERALKAGARLGGHIVSGHVDGVGTLASEKPISGSLEVTFEVPKELAKFIAEKGSICVNGVSLTVNGVDGTRFWVMLIPHTRQMTTFGSLGVGALVNLEVDVLARYVARLHETGSV